MGFESRQQLLVNDAIALVVANGDIDDDRWIEAQLKRAQVIVAANGGTRHLYRLGVLPDVVVGDGDSISAETRTWLTANSVHIIKAPTAKDETDLELALLYAIENHNLPIEIIGALGGRLDQTIANLLLLAHPRLLERKIVVTAPHQRAWLIEQSGTVHGQIGDTVSLIPLGGSAHIHATSGLRWQLHDSVLQFGPARGVSNVLTAPTATIEIASGIVLCVHIDQSWAR